MSRESDFIARWDAEKDAYAAWGHHVSERIKEAAAKIVAPVPISYFLRIAVEPRLKADKKLIEKAFYRKKNYADPFEAITDKVGTRFVVLLGRDIPKVVEALESIEGWTRSRDRDYEREQNENPVEFDYAAVHYVVRPTEALVVDGVAVPSGTPCEVQIKTILQHAYSELTHDTIYKPQIQATSAMRRNAAKAMALLEATNDYFEKVDDEVNSALSNVRSITRDLSSVYREMVGLEPSPSLIEGLLLEAYEKLATEGYLDETRKMLADKSFLIDRIKKRVAERSPLFEQPSILLAYLDIVRNGGDAKYDWPLTPQEMEPLLVDLGESIH